MKFTLTHKLLLALAVFSIAWFKSEGPAFLGFRTINNTFEASTNDTFEVNYDLGDSDPAIVAKYGRGVNVTNAFKCGYPVSITIFLTANPPPPALPVDQYYGPYSSFTLQYAIGNTITGNAWTTIASVNVSDFTPLEGKTTAMFGIGLKWVPPYTNNVDYLLRIYGTTTGNGSNPPAYSADLASTNTFTAKGDGATWDDWEVLGIRVIPNKRPGM
jgi:hypothetical protein